jgi:hypothetical protein
MEKDTGLQYLEEVVRYLASVLDEKDLSLKEMKEIAEQAVSKDTGGYIMTTIAQRLHNEGRLEGEIKGRLEGEIKGLREAIELGITLKFPGDIDAVMARVNVLDDLETLTAVKEAIKTAKDGAEILALLK